MPTDQPPTAGPVPGAPTLDALLDDDARVDAAVASAQHEAVRTHHLLGRAVVIWHDGRIVEALPPGGASPALAHISPADPDARPPLSRPPAAG